MKSGVSQKLSGLFLIVFCVLFFAVLVGATLNIDKDLLSGYARYALPLGALFGALVLLWGAFVKRREAWLSAHYKIIVAACCAAFFALQMVFAYILEFDGMYDILNIHNAAVELAQTGALSIGSARYVSNFPTTETAIIYLAALAKLPLALGIDVKRFWVVFICLRTLMCIPMTFYIARREINMRAAFTSLLFWMCSAAILFNSASVYSHTITFPYTVLLCFLYVYLKNHSTRRAALWCCAGLIYAVAVGTIVMRLTAVMAIAIFVDALLRSNKKDIFKPCAAAALALAVTLGGLALVERAALSAVSGNDEPGTPAALWTLTALSERTLGRYDVQDRSAVMSYATYEEREAACEEMIKRRIEAFGPAGLALHMYKKTIVEMGSGCMLFEDLIFENPVREGPLHRYLIITGDQIMVTRTVIQAGYLVVLALLIFHAATSLADKQRPLLYIYIALFGLVFATMLSETNPRHIISYLPLMYVAAGAGLDKLPELWGALKARRAARATGPGRAGK